MRRHTIALALAAVAAALLLAGCEKTIGQGVLLWSYSDGEIRVPSGTVVPVYLQSNIDRLYVIGVPGASRKIEVPFWQVRTFGSGGEARAYVEKLGNLASMYAIALKDGLPVRKAPTNVATRVYRLKVNEVVKLLEKVEGDKVMTGNQELPGDWYRVLAQDGTEGYIYSYTLQMYDEARQAAPAAASGGSDTDTGVSSALETIYAKAWRPEYFRQMLDAKALDLDRFGLQYGLFADGTLRQIRIETPEISQTFRYSKVTLDPATGMLSFGDTSLRIKLDGSRRLEVELPDPSAGGKTLSLVFLDIAEDVKGAVDAETKRRQKALESFVAEFGELSGPGGTLAVMASGDFSWTGYEASGVLPEGSGSAGAVKIRLAVAPALQDTYFVALSFRFSGSSTWYDFAARRVEGGLVLVPVTAASLEGALLATPPLDDPQALFVTN